MSEWAYRIAEPEDAEQFAEWVKANPQIDPDDVNRTIKGSNPTCLTLVACCDGKPVAFVPVYCSMVLAHLAFNPEARAAEKIGALGGLLDFATAIAVQFGVRELITLTKADFGVAKWAAENGFEQDNRDLFRYDINKVLAEATKE